MKKQLRLLAWILSLTMLCELLPFSAFAQSSTTEISNHSNTHQTVPSDAFQFYDKYFKFYDSSDLENVITWEDASQFCQSLGGHLAIIHSQEENDFLFDSMKSLGYSNAYFGYTDAKVEGEWEWVIPDSSTYTNWAYGEPNNESDSEDYAMFYWKYDDGTWNDGTFVDGTNNGGHIFICEWDNTPTKEFTFKRDNLSFLNDPDYFFKGKEREYWYYVYEHPNIEKKDYPRKFRNKPSQYASHHISEEKFKQITANLSPSVLDWIKLKVFSGSIWHGSCYGMTTVAAIHYMTPDKLPLGKLSSANLLDSDSLFSLPSPMDNSEVESLINYYYLAQLLPTRYKIFSNYLYNCANNFDDTLNEVVNSLAQGVPVIANTSSHSVLLINIKETTSDYYVLGVYDPNKTDEQSMILYKTPYTNPDDGETYLHISYRGSEYLQFYILASDSNILDIRNYFGLGSDNESATEYNDAHITIDADNNFAVVYKNQYYYRSKDGVLLEKDPNVLVVYLTDQSSESFESNPIELVFPKPSASEDVKLELSSEGINEANMILDHTTLAISSTGSVDVTYNEQNQTLDLTSDDPVDISLMLTQNDTTENWPWHSWAIDTTGTTTLHAELTDEGLKLSGDGLNNAAFATENADTEDVQTSTISAKADSNTGVASVTIKNNQDSEGNNTLEVTQPSNTTKPTAHTISVTNGSASVTSAASGEIVTITAADKSAEKKVFTGWTVNSGNVTLDDSSASTTSFVMGSENVSIIANYKTVSTTPSEPTKPTEPDKPETPSSDDDGSGALILLGVGAAAVAAATAGVVYMMPIKIQGKVESGDHVAIPNAKVSILKNGNIVAQATADENGNFEFKVKRGTYELTAAYTDASGQLIHQTIQQKAPAKNVVITF